MATKPGLLEGAHGGTLFLDEIGELPINVQAKLLSMIFFDSDVIDLSDLVLTTPSSGNNAVDDSCWTVPTVGIDLVDLERRLILSALDRSENNKSKAARLLGLTRHTLRYRMEKHGFS